MRHDSSIPVNPLAPGISTALSKEAEAEVARIVASGKLSPFATPNEAVIRRDQSRDISTPMRPSFMRDAEKIIHVPAYNRLAGKTQVFSFKASDDLTRRGLHVQLVTKIARDIGRALGLNTDLIEAIGLGHDIGHTPFGHAGERLLDAKYHQRTGRFFRHNVQSVRVLDVLYGRNISLQTLDGVICHNGEFEQQILYTSDLASFEDFDRGVEQCWQEGDKAILHLKPMTLEGCVLRVSDIIAYVGKDRQDAISAKLLDEDSFADGLGGGYNTWALTTFAVDIVENSLGKDHICMSEAAFKEMARAKRENYHLIYKAKEVESSYSSNMNDIFSSVYDVILEDLAAGRQEAPVFKHHIARLEHYLKRYGMSYAWEDDPDMCAVDYISSMTDEYFVQYASYLFPEAKEAFPSYRFFD